MKIFLQQNLEKTSHVNSRPGLKFEAMIIASEVDFFLYSFNNLHY